MKRTLLVIGVVLAGSLARGAPESDEGAVTIPLRPYVPPTPLRCDFAAEPAPVEKRTALGFALGDETVVLVDVNGNGRHGERGVDGWTLAGDAYRHLVPLERWIVVGTRKVSLTVALDGKTVTHRVEEASIPSKERRRRGGEVLAGLARWNELRLANGLLPAPFDADLAAGCNLHAAYCALHGITHHEDPSKDLYTKAGAEAGRWSGIGSAEPVAEVDLSYRALFHRMQLIHATTEAIGIGTSGGVTVLDGSRARGRRQWRYPVLIPAPGTTGHPRAFSVERPAPHPEVFTSPRALRGAGCPVTLTFERDTITDVEAELREVGPSGRAVEVLVSWPEKPANADIPDNYKTIGLVPRSALKARTVYWVRVRYAYQGEADVREWTFETAR